MVLIDDLPAELIDCVLLYLTWKDILSCYHASRIFHVVSNCRLRWLMYDKTPVYTLLRYRILDGIRYKVEIMNMHINDRILRLAIMFDCMEIIDYFVECGFTIMPYHLNYAITYCNMNMIKHLHNKWKVPFDLYSSIEAARYCLVHELKELKTMGIIYNNCCVDIAVKRGAYYVIVYLYSIGLRASTLIHAAKCGNVTIAKLLLRYNARNNNLAINLAARNGHLDMITFLHAKKATATQYAIHQAAKYNYLEVVHYLHFIGTNKDNITFDMALTGCELKMCKYLWIMGLYCSRTGIQEVAKRGDVDIMRCIHEKQRPYFHMNELNPLDTAATYGHKKLVQYLITIGYPIHGTSIQQVIVSGNIELFDIIISCIEPIL